MERKLLGVLAGLVLLGVFAAGFGFLLEGMRVAREQPAAAAPTPTSTAAAKQGPTFTATPGLGPTSTSLPSPALKASSSPTATLTAPWRADSVRIVAEKVLGPYEGGAAWSPDSRNFVFQRLGGVFRTPDDRVRRRYDNLWIADREGNNVRLLVERASDAVWAPDGRKVYYQAYVPRDLVNDSKNLDLASVRPDGSGFAVLLSGNAPSGFPAPQPLPPGRVALIRDQRHLAVADGDAGTVLMELKDLFPAKDAASSTFPLVGFRFSPDGARLAYATDASMTLARADGGAATRFPAQIRGIINFTWSPDSRSLAYGADWSLWVAEADGARPRLLVSFKAMAGGDPGGEARFGGPYWSPDGMVVFFSFSADARNGIDTYAINVEGGQARRITTGGYPLRPLSPDGSRALITRCDRTGDCSLILAWVEH